MILSCAAFCAAWMTRVGNIRRSCTLASSGSTSSPRASGPARAFAAATASWTARLMPIPPIGDMACAASPIGGIGINLAVQDAVAAANALAGPLSRGEDVDPLLARVQERRMFPTRVIQAGQKAAQDNIIGRLLTGSEPIRQAPFIIRLFNTFPLLRRIPGRIVGLGVRRERVRSPLAPPPRTS